jgi:hypothetical protein
MMIITPNNHTTLKSVFLAGTIDMGNSPNWQKEVAEALDSPDLLISNPRRDDEIFQESDVNFQIKWELNQIKRADAVFMYFAPNSLSPITLLELGLIIQMYDTKFVVVCPKTYSRYQNVRLTIQEFSRPGMIVNESLHGGIEDLKSLLRI